MTDRMVQRDYSRLDTRRPDGTERGYDAMRERAHRIVAHAVRDGRLVPLACGARDDDGSVCGKMPAQAHHDDYTKPLDVRWLCNVHHRRRHVQMNIARQTGTIQTITRRGLRDLDFKLLAGPVTLVEQLPGGFWQRVAVITPLRLVDE